MQSSLNYLYRLLQCYFLEEKYKKETKIYKETVDELNLDLKMGTRPNLAASGYYMVREIMTFFLHLIRVASIW